MDKIENSLIESIPEIKDEIQKTLQNIKNIKINNGQENINYNNDSNYEDIKTNPKKKSISNHHTIHITYFIPVLQFLDIKSIIELSKVNHIFNSFIYSLFFYRSSNQVLLFSNKNIKNKNSNIYHNSKIKQIKKQSTDDSNSNLSNDGNIILGPTKKIYSSFMSALTGALSYITPIPEMPKIHKDKKELEEIKKKIDLHEKLLNERIKQMAISNEIKATRAEIDKYIKEQYELKKSKKNENNKNKINEETIKKLKRDKYELEYKNLMKEVNQYEEEYIRLKKDNEVQNKVGIDLEIKINKIKYYAKNKFLPK